MKALILAALLATIPDATELSRDIFVGENIKEDFSNAVIEMAKELKEAGCVTISVSAYMDKDAQKLTIYVKCEAKLLK